MMQQLTAARAVRTGIGRSATVIAPWANRRDADDLARLSPALGTALGAEVRADLIGDIDLAAARTRVAGPVIFSLRSTAYQGAATDGPQARSQRLTSAAARGFDLVDLEFDHDLVPDVLAEIPAPRRLVSWHGTVSELRTHIAKMTAVPAAMYRLTVAAQSFVDALQPLQLLATLHRDDVTAFGTGPAAAFGRVLAPWFGAPVVFGGSDGPATRELLTDYPFPRLPSLDGLYLFVVDSNGTPSPGYRLGSGAGTDLQPPATPTNVRVIR